MKQRGLVWLLLVAGVIVTGCESPVEPEPLQLAAPTFSHPEGVYGENIEIELYTNTDNASIYYSTDESDPSTRYTSPITVEGDGTSTTIRAMAVADGFEDSDSSEITYEIDHDMMEGGVLHGDVTYQGDPVSEVLVVYLDDNGNETDLKDSTDASGTYQLTFKPIGDGGLAFRHDDYLDQVQFFHFTGSDREFNVELERGTITYHGNGHSSGNPPESEWFADDPGQLSPADPGDLRGPAIADGITQRLRGWNTRPDGSGTMYEPGEEYNHPEHDLDLYAQWTTGLERVGKTGPAGGHVFFWDEGNEHAEFRYLEAAPYITERTGIAWGGYQTEVGEDAQGEEIGDGEGNTAAIIAEYGGREPYDDDPDYAAIVADDLEHNGYDDWFLPSRDELDLIHEEVFQEGIGYFASEPYWSSSEDTDWRSYAIDFGRMFNRDRTITKTNKQPIRAVRAF